MYIFSFNKIATNSINILKWLDLRMQIFTYPSDVHRYFKLLLISCMYASIRNLQMWLKAVTLSWPPNPNTHKGVFTVIFQVDVMKEPHDETTIVTDVEQTFSVPPYCSTVPSFTMHPSVACIVSVLRTYDVKACLSLWPLLIFSPLLLKHLIQLSHSFITQ